jgi:hypothetical protein
MAAHAPNASDDLMQQRCQVRVLLSVRLWQDRAVFHSLPDATLDVVRYDARGIAVELGSELELREVRRETHVTR